MRQLRKAGPALAGVCAAVLTVSLSACVTGTGPAKAAPDTGTSAVSTAAVGATAPAGRHDHVRVRTVARRMARTVRIPWRALAGADAIAVAGNRVWVANSGSAASGGWLAEIDAATGALVRIVAGQRYGLADPVALAVDGNTLWVADGNGDAVTEVDAATGALIRVIAGQEYQLADPAAIAAGGGHVWVASAGANSVTEIDAATGALVRVLSAPRYRLDTTVYPPAIAVAGDRVWVTDGNSDALTEIDADDRRADQGHHRPPVSAERPGRDRRHGRPGLGRQRRQQLGHRDRRRHRRADQGHPPAAQRALRDRR